MFRCLDFVLIGLHWIMKIISTKKKVKKIIAKGFKSEMISKFLLLNSPDNPPTSIFFRFLASKITTVSFPAVGTYLKDKHMSPSRSL